MYDMVQTQMLPVATETILEDLLQSKEQAFPTTTHQLRTEDVYGDQSILERLATAAAWQCGGYSR